MLAMQNSSGSLFGDTEHALGVALSAPVSPNGGRTRARAALYRRFASRVAVSPHLNRRLVSYQGNKGAVGFRWMKYKEGFSTELVRQLIHFAKGTQVLDPFSGSGTTVLTAMGMGVPGTGIEILPLGNMAAQAVAHAANGLSRSAFRDASRALLHAVAHEDYDDQYALKHVPITRGAFPNHTGREIAKARKFIAQESDPALSTLLSLACLSVLEDVSYTRKDGQFLRWDPRSGRTASTKLNKGRLPTFSTALAARLHQIQDDIRPLKQRYAGPVPTFITGSSLTELQELDEGQFDCVVTSPPYANRYDYTRTYAVELVYLGYGDQPIKALRQALLSATVENRSKRAELRTTYRDTAGLDDTFRMVDEQGALQEVLTVLRDHAAELSNRNVLSLLENYFTEMAVIVRELGRVVRPGGSVFMVNDNVRYHGEEVPVDFILSDFAEQSGFRCDAIWMLRRGKGNSSQQMGRFGRCEIRKCVYRWVRVERRFAHIPLGSGGHDPHEIRVRARHSV